MGMKQEEDSFQLKTRDDFRIIFNIPTAEFESSLDFIDIETLPEVSLSDAKEMWTKSTGILTLLIDKTPEFFNYEPFKKRLAVIKGKYPKFKLPGFTNITNEYFATLAEFIEDTTLRKDYEEYIRKLNISASSGSNHRMEKDVVARKKTVAALKKFVVCMGMKQEEDSFQLKTRDDFRIIFNIPSEELESCLDFIDIETLPEVSLSDVEDMENKSTGIFTLLIGGKGGGRNAPKFLNYEPFKKRLAVIKEKDPKFKLPGFTNTTDEYFVALAEFIEDPKLRIDYERYIRRLHIPDKAGATLKEVVISRRTMLAALKKFVVCMGMKQEEDSFQLKTRDDFRAIFNIPAEEFESSLDFIDPDTLPEVSLSDVEEMEDKSTGIFTLFMRGKGNKNDQEFLNYKPFKERLAIIREENSKFKLPAFTNCTDEYFVALAEFIEDHKLRKDYEEYIEKLNISITAGMTMKVITSRKTVVAALKKFVICLGAKKEGEDFEFKTRDDLFSIFEIDSIAKDISKSPIQTKIEKLSVEEAILLKRIDELVQQIEKLPTEEDIKELSYKVMQYEAEFPGSESPRLYYKNIGKDWFNYLLSLCSLDRKYHKYYVIKWICAHSYARSGFNFNENSVLYYGGKYLFQLTAENDQLVCLAQTIEIHHGEVNFELLSLIPRTDGIQDQIDPCDFACTLIDLTISSENSTLRGVLEIGSLCNLEADTYVKEERAVITGCQGAVSLRVEALRIRMLELQTLKLMIEKIANSSAELEIQTNKEFVPLIVNQVNNYMTTIEADLIKDESETPSETNRKRIKRLEKAKVQLQTIKDSLRQSTQIGDLSELMDEIEFLIENASNSLARAWRWTTADQLIFINTSLVEIEKIYKHWHGQYLRSRALVNQHLSKHEEILLRSYFSHCKYISIDIHRSYFLQIDKVDTELHKKYVLEGVSKRRAELVIKIASEYGYFPENLDQSHKAKDEIAFLANSIGPAEDSEDILAAGSFSPIVIRFRKKVS